jgi:hypothetical protein
VVKKWALRLSIASFLVAWTILGTFGRAHASLGFCRGDPTVTFQNADGSRGTVVLSAGISLPSNQVASVTWTIQLPAGSTLEKVASHGKVTETVAVTTDGPAGIVTASAFVSSLATADVTVDIQSGRNPHNSATSVSGSTNITLTVSTGL